MPRLVAAPDKFRGTATARQVAGAIAAAARAAGWECDEVPVADGGEGILDALGGRMRSSPVHGPLGDWVEAEWRLQGSTAVVEMARASGLALLGGPEHNDPIRASTVGTGELIAAAVGEGAQRVIIGLGGSATTDGGYPCVQALEPHSRLHGVELLVACDVTTRFLDAATVFAPQKGATAAQVDLLSRRLARLAQVYEDNFGVDVRQLEGGGAAGGLAGGLAALGGHLRPGFDLVADAVELDERIEGADLVVTGEGLLDDQSFNGKAVGGVAAMAAGMKVPVLVVAGDAVGDQPVAFVSLVARFGQERARADTLACVEEVVREHLARS